MALATAALVAAAQPAEAAAPSVVFRSVIGGPVAVSDPCAGSATGLRSDAAPLIGRVPGRRGELRVTYQAHGERIQVGAASHDAGRSWRRTAIPSATQCLGGPSDHNLSVNPLFDVGAGGSAWFGESWFNDPAEDFEFWSFGVDLHEWPRGRGAWRAGIAAPPPDESSQNLAVAAHPRDADEAAIAWTHMDQVPNPVTYAPLGTELRFAVRDDGEWAQTAVVHETLADHLIVNGRVTRVRGDGYVAIFDLGALADLPAAQLGLANVPLPLYASRSATGADWSPPVRIGDAEVIQVDDPEGASAARIVSTKPDLTSGPGGAVAAAWVEEDRHTVRLARSADGGRTWSPPVDTVRLGGPGVEPAVSFDRRGNLGLFYYDAFSDRTADGAWMVQPRFAVSRRNGGRWRDIALSRPFDARAVESCGQVCESHATALGVFQDVEGLRRGFGVGFTIGPPVAANGRTDAVYARVSPR